MATQAHCAYAFECLAASYEKRQPLSLAQVEDLWEQYQRGDKPPNDGLEATEGEVETDANPAKPAAISRLLNRDDSATSSNTSLPSTGGSSTASQKPDSGAATPASSQSSLSSRSSPTDKCPLFVTWNIVSKSGHKSLRGCIGTFEAQPLEKGLRSYALTSAFEDTRFEPIPSSALPSLSTHITLLTNFSAPSSDALDWTVGTHGIRIAFSHRGRRYGATYLPDVAVEQGWSKEEAILSLMRKAGWNGSSSSWVKVWTQGGGELVRYEGKAVRLGYEAWKRWRRWVDELEEKRLPN